MKRVFISYSRQNIAFAKRLARDLQDAGLDVWIDFRQIKGGDIWREEIFRGINYSEMMVVCLSPQAVESEWVRREILMAHSQHKFVVPLMVQPCFDLMPQFDETKQLLDVQIVDFDALGYDSAFPILLDSLPGLIRAGGHVDIDPDLIPNPFKGLEAFQQTDANIFFGRGETYRETDRTACKRRWRRKMLHVFLRLWAQVAAEKARWCALDSFRRFAVDGWRILLNGRWSFLRPVRARQRQWLRACCPLTGETLLPNLMTALENGAASLHQVAQGLLAQMSEYARLVLVIDQFEEVFTRASLRERIEFLELLHYAVKVEDGPVIGAITMRADFFDRLSNHPEIAELFEQRNMVIATEMTPEQLRRSIEAPAQAVGLIYEEGLSDRILEDVRQQPGSLPLVAVCAQGVV